MQSKYIYFCSNFINFFVQNNNAQSTDFALGTLIQNNIINTSDQQVDKIDKFSIIEKHGGKYIIDTSSRNNNGFILDLENLHDFNINSGKLLGFLTRLFRFYVKKSNNYPLSSYEVHISNSSNYVVNPFNFTTQDFYKIIVSTNPDQKRNEQRKINIMLNINDGRGIVDPDNYSLKNYRKVVQNLQEVHSIAEAVKPDNESLELKKIYNLSEEPIIDEINNYIGFENWKFYLSEPQKEFALSDRLGPTRIMGPAGSGKTLSLIIKAIHLAKKSKQNDEIMKIGFICHSQGMRDNIHSILQYDASEFLNENGNVVIEVITLTEWLIKYAVKDFSEEDCLEVDSEDMKIMQLLMIENSIKYFCENELNTYKPFLSNKFKDFLYGNNQYNIAEIVRHEIATYIKGSGIESLEDYAAKSSPTKLIPWENREDLVSIYRIYKLYQESLDKIGKYDIDDVCQVALGYLPKQIWKRNRRNNGYDTVLIDEMHLFDFSELQIVPYLTKRPDDNHINCAIDTAQSTIEQDLASKHIANFFDGSVADSNLNVVFRSTESIIRLTQFLFETNIELFLNDNPLANAVTTISKKEATPEVIFGINDNIIAEILVDRMKSETCNRKNNLIVCCDICSLDKLADLFNKADIPVEIIRRRGDSSIQKVASRKNAIMLAYIDYIGGLEFDNVTIFGFDIDKIPPSDTSISVGFNEHLWYRKIYVAFTRARKKLTIISNKEKGIHRFLDSALNEKLITNQDH